MATVDPEAARVAARALGTTLLLPRRPCFCAALGSPAAAAHHVARDDGQGGQPPDLQLCRARHGGAHVAAQRQLRPGQRCQLGAVARRRRRAAQPCGAELVAPQPQPQCLGEHHRFYGEHAAGGAAVYSRSVARLTAPRLAERQQQRAALCHLTAGAGGASAPKHTRLRRERDGNASKHCGLCRQRGPEPGLRLGARVVRLEARIARRRAGERRATGAGQVEAARHPRAEAQCSRSVHGA